MGSGLRALDSEHVLPLATAGQAVVGGAGDRAGVQGRAKPAGSAPTVLSHDRGLGIDCGTTYDFACDQQTLR